VNEKCRKCGKEFDECIAHLCMSCGEELDSIYESVYKHWFAGHEIVFVVPSPKKEEHEQLGHA